MNIYIGKLTQIYLYIFAPFLICRYFPIILFYYTSANRAILKEDLENTLKEYRVKYIGIINLLWAISQNPFWLTLFYYRIGKKKSFICNFIKKDKSSLMLVCDKIGRDIHLYHPFATIINAKSLGNNFICRNNTTIGNKNNDHKLRPVIGNNVEIGANSIIFGDINIGNNVTIGAGSVINKDVPDNCIAFGNPFKIIKKA